MLYLGLDMLVGESHLLIHSSYQSREPIFGSYVMGFDDATGIT